MNKLITVERDMLIGETKNMLGTLYTIAEAEQARAFIESTKVFLDNRLCSEEELQKTFKGLLPSVFNSGLRKLFESDTELFNDYTCIGYEVRVELEAFLPKMHSSRSRSDMIALISEMPYSESVDEKMSDDELLDRLLFLSAEHLIIDILFRGEIDYYSTEVMAKIEEMEECPLFVKEALIAEANRAFNEKWGRRIPA